jgi:hypothetical protein
MLLSAFTESGAARCCPGGAPSSGLMPPRVAVIRISRRRLLHARAASAFIWICCIGVGTKTANRVTTVLADADVNAIRALMESLMRAIFDHLYPDALERQLAGKTCEVPQCQSAQPGRDIAL